MTTEQYYEFWERFAASQVMEELPDNIEEICAEMGVTVDYYIHEWL
jgi:hypothetical protein